MRNCYWYFLTQHELKTNFDESLDMWPIVAPSESVKSIIYFSITTDSGLCPWKPLIRYTLQFRKNILKSKNLKRETEL